LKAPELYLARRYHISRVEHCKRANRTHWHKAECKTTKKGPRMNLPNQTKPNLTHEEPCGPPSYTTLKRPFIHQATTYPGFEWQCVPWQASKYTKCKVCRQALLDRYQLIFDGWKCRKTLDTPAGLVPLVESMPVGLACAAAAKVYRQTTVKAGGRARLVADNKTIQSSSNYYDKAWRALEPTNRV